jgi:glycosyltransferase involved in cell wall biosynthesis
MINLLFVADFPMYETKGGVQRVTTTLAKALKEKQIGVKYLALMPGEMLLLDGFENHFLPNALGLKNSENSTFLKNFLKENRINFIINQAGILQDSIDFLKTDLPKEIKIFTVHHNCISCLQENYRNIIKGSIYGKIGAVLDFPWFWNLLMQRNKNKYGRFFKNAIAKSDKFILLSKSFIPELKTYIDNWDENKITAIYNPVPFEVQPQAMHQKENRILFVGRVEYSQKQCELLLPIWEAISKKFPNWHFDIVGGGSKLQELITKVKDTDLKNIHFHGFNDPKPFLTKAKVFCMTSAFEGFGMVLVEAQAYGVVPIAFSSFSSLSSIIQDGNNGFTVTPFNINEYIDKLSHLMNEETVRFQMATNAQKSVKRFLPTNIAQEWIDLFSIN